MSGYWGGAPEMAAALKEVKRRKTEGARRGIWLVLTEALGRSNATVPHEEGDLERDGAASLADGDELRGAISYGRNADTKDYAVVQHEDMTLRHDAGRNAKFLENALNGIRGEAGEIIAASVRKEVNR